MPTPTFFALNTTISGGGTMAAPDFDPAPDYYPQDGSVVVTITCSSSPDWIFWKKNSMPTHSGEVATNGTTRIVSGGSPKPSAPSGPFPGTETQINALAYKNGFNDSPITSGTYTVERIEE